MNILFITLADPREVSDGARQRTNLLWNALKELGEVYTAVWRYETMPRIHAPDEKIESVAVYPEGWRGKLRSLIYNHFYKPTAWPFSTPFAKRFPWKGVKFDLAVGRYLESVWVSRAWKSMPMIVDIDDWPPETYSTIWAKEYWPWWRAWARFVVRKWTGAALSKCTAAWICTAAHEKCVKPFAMPFAFLPNMASPGVYAKAKPRNQLMTVGLMSHQPNYEGVDWFLREMWPRVREMFPGIEYAIAGKGAPAALAKRWADTPGVKVLGFVEDLDALYCDSRAVVAPIFSGSGTCIKTLEAAVRGKVVFAADAAMRGFDDAARKRLGLTPLERLCDELPLITPEREAAIAAEAAKVNSLEFFNSQVKKLVEGVFQSRRRTPA